MSGRGPCFLCPVLITLCLALPYSSEAASSIETPKGSGVPGTPVAVLGGEVREYLTTSDPERASQFLDAILDHPNADLARIESTIRTEPTYEVQPVGRLPAQVVLVRGRNFRYGLYVPPSYSPERSYALVICLHGAGFTGDSYLTRWQKRLGDNYVLGCPTLIQGTWWTQTAEDLVLSTIQAVRERYRIDPDRIFLTGMSNGGIGAWLIGCHYASHFAGLSPMASGLDDVLFPFLENLMNTPTYIIHGRQDHVMPVELSRSIARSLSGLGYPFVLREHDWSHPHAGGHFFPRQELPDLVAWLDNQRRTPLPTHIKVVRDASHLKRFGWVRIDATDRIAYFPENLIEGRDALIVNRVYAELEATIVEPNRIEVRTSRVRRYTLFLNGSLVDLQRPVTVITNGAPSHSGRVEPSVETLLREARARRDRQMLFPVALTLSVEAGP